jgi:glucose/arabinose dehydrogenase
MPQVPQSFGYKTEKAFGTLTFATPVAIRTAPGERNRLFVVEQGGRVFAITNLAAPNKTLFLDLSKQVRVGGDEGFFALAFHPGYATNGYFFGGYNLSTRTDAGSGTHYRVSRFSVSANDPNLASTNSELPLITHRYVGTGICDDLLFGPDGCLYAAVADPNADNGGTLQSIDTNLFGGILRIDVDKKPGSLASNPHPAVTANYAIPFDNPFVGVTSFNGLPVDPAKVRTEFYAVGLRNPWRMTFDEASGLLYVGDPGSNQRDEINVIVKGGNYGWPYREGTGNGPKSSKTPPGFESINPIHQYSNPSAVIGGLVYHGQRYPELQGAYIFGDWVNGTISALRYGGINLVPAQKLTVDAGVTGFGLDPSTGDVLLVDREENRIKRLIYSTNLVGTPLPPTLAETGAFSDLTTLTPHAGIVPYDLNLPFWSDNARKTRWFSVPDATQTIGFNREGNWSFPAGTVWIKHFELELTNGVPESARRLETRLIVRTTNGVYGVTYRWGDSLTNAVLVPEEGLDETFTIHEAGAVRTQVWHYPSRSECLTCHTPIAGLALGFNTAQLNRDNDYGGARQSQIRALSDAGYFSSKVAEFYTLPALAHPTNAAVSLDFRVHSYLAANCVQCHQPGGAVRTHFDARLSTPLSTAGLIDGSLFDSLGDSENRVIKPGSLDRSVLLIRLANLGRDHMPPLATSVVNPQAIELLSDWITNGVAQYQSYGDWQLANFGSTNAPNAAPSSDADDDGAINQLEYLTGTNPMLAGDGWAIRLTLAEPQAGIQFPRIANRGFEVQWTTNVADPNSWQPLDLPGNEPLFSATNSTVTVQDQIIGAPRKFYRVRIFEP